MFKIGEYTTIREIKQQNTHWVVLINLNKNSGNVLGGMVDYIAETKAIAGDKAIDLESKGIELYISRGAFEPINIGEMFAD